MKPLFGILLFYWIGGDPIEAGAQTYPVSATLQLTPPYSVYLSDYTVNDQMKLHLLLRDLSEPSYQVRLSLVLEGVGIRIETNPNMVPPPIFIEGGIPSILSAEDLAPYLDTRNLIFSGISRQEYEQRAALPEGFYRFCFRVYDYKRKDVLLSQEACAQAWFMLNDPPRINTPLCGITLPVLDPQNILFQWLPMNANSPNSTFTTEYEFTLVEIRPPGRNPNDAINVGYPLFQTTTQQTSLIYGLLEPPLIPGQEYAFRIRAIDTEGRDQFKNRGYSEVCTFKFGDTNGVPPLEGMNVYVEGERRAKVTWFTSIETDRYRVEYRKKSSGTGYTWFTIETTQDNALIQDLEPDTEYEVRVAGILRNQIGSYSTTKNFRTTPPRVFACGQEVANITPSNIKPLNTSMVGQIWKVGHFDMVVMEASGGDGTYSGLGSVVVDYMGIKFFCRFDNIKVNEKQEIVVGEVIVLRDDAEAFKKRLIENSEKKKKDKAKGTSFEGIDLKFDGTIDSLYVNEAGEVIAVVVSSEGTSGGSSKKEERKIDTKKGVDNRITDEAGNVYVVGKEGTIEKMGSTGASGTAAVAANVNYRVDFESSSNQTYGFDQQQYSEHERNYEKYERDGKVYTIPWKSVASGSNDVVIAKSTESRKDFSKEVIYKTDQGLLLRKPGNQENEVQLTVQGFGDQSTEQVTAYYKRKEADGKEKEVMAGKLNIVSYDKLVERLVIVSVNNTAPNISTTELAESLNTIFAPAAVTWTVESQSIADINYDSNGKSGLDDGSSGLFSNYTSEMRTVINAYQDQYDIASHTWYLFLVPNSESGRTQGFMPRKKQAGFIFMEQLGEAPLAKVIAHEIGHGAFRLEHTFSTYNTLEKYSTDNLMDYQPNGITLHKYQWDLIHDPAAVLGLFEEDEGGAMSLPCLGIFDDCDDVLRVLKNVKEATSAGETLIAKMPTDKKSRKEANFLKIEGVEYTKIAIVYEGETNSKYDVNPRDYSDIQMEVMLNTGVIDKQVGFTFKKDERIVVKVLLYEPLDEIAQKKESLRKYLFETAQAKGEEVKPNSAQNTDEGIKRAEIANRIDQTDTRFYGRFIEPERLTDDYVDCAEFVYEVLTEQGFTGFPSGGCNEQYNWYKEREKNQMCIIGTDVNDVKVGDIILWSSEGGDPNSFSHTGIVVEKSDGKVSIVNAGFRGCKCDNGKWKTYTKEGKDGKVQRYETMEDCYSDKDKCSEPSIWRSDGTNTNGYFKANTLDSNDHVFGYWARPLEKK